MLDFRLSVQAFLPNQTILNRDRLGTLIFYLLPSISLTIRLMFPTPLLYLSVPLTFAPKVGFFNSDFCLP